MSDDIYPVESIVLTKYWNTWITIPEDCEPQAPQSIVPRTRHTMRLNLLEDILIAPLIKTNEYRGIRGNSGVYRCIRGDKKETLNEQASVSRGL
jgi:hypothetical protein